MRIPAGDTGGSKELRMASDKVHEFGTDNWQKEVVDSTVPVLVDFWAPWCGPCRALTPIVDRLAEQFAGKVKVGKVNIDENGDLAAQYGVNSIPRILVFKGSATPVKSVVGLRGEAELTQLLNSVTG
jgi:thioredoxin